MMQIYMEAEIKPSKLFFVLLKQRFLVSRVDQPDQH